MRWVWPLISLSIFSGRKERVDRLACAEER